MTICVTVQNEILEQNVEYFDRICDFDVNCLLIAVAPQGGEKEAQHLEPQRYILDT